VSGYCLQGIGCRFGEVIHDGTKFLYLTPGCMTLASEVRLLIDHQGKSIATTDNRLAVHVGEKSLAFRYFIPERLAESFEDYSGDLETYIGVSCGFSKTKSELMTIDGAQIEVVTEATLNEISLTNEEPAVKTTFARVVNADSCGDLASDCERFELVGSFIGVHRKFKASENGGKVKYSNVTSPYNRAANNFERKLRDLM
jgi:hypothetical protein